MFKPLNRFILIEELNIGESPDQQSTILVPDDYVAKSPYSKCKVLKVASGCEQLSEADVEKTIIVNASMIENIKLPYCEYSIVLENYVYGIL